MKSKSEAKAEKRFFVKFRDCTIEVGIGHKVYMKGPNGGEEGEIESFGVKYLEVGSGRSAEKFEINTGYHKTTYQHKELWSSYEAYLADKLHKDTIWAFFNLSKNSYSNPDWEKKLTTEKIRQAAEILGLTEELDDEIKKRTRR